MNSKSIKTTKERNEKAKVRSSILFTKEFCHRPQRKGIKYLQYSHIIMQHTRIFIEHIHILSVFNFEKNISKEYK